MTTNIGALMRDVGKRATVVYRGIDGHITVECAIVDVALKFGRVRYQVQPVSGHGTTWVDSLALTVGRECAA